MTFQADPDGASLLDLPAGCLKLILEGTDGLALARLGAVCREWKLATADSKLWQPHYDRQWRPAHQGLIKPCGCSHDYRNLYTRWQAGVPADVSLLKQVHGRNSRVSWTAHNGAGRNASQDFENMRKRVNAIQLANSDQGICCYSVGDDGCLAVVDLQTGRDVGGVMKAHDAPAQCLALLAGDGSSTSASGMPSAVCTAGSDRRVRCWDLRVSSAVPAWEMQNAHHDEIFCMLAARAVDAGGAAPLLFTGGGDNTVNMWDLRMLGEQETVPLLQLYDHGDTVYSLAVDASRNVLYTGSGDKTINRYDLVTGEWLTALTGHQGDVYSLAMGPEHLMSGGDDGTVCEWQLYGKADAPEEQSPAARLGMRREMNEEGATTQTHITCLQGLGVGPAGVLAGTWEGSLVLAERLGRIRPMGRAVPREQGDGFLPITCLAVSDLVLANAFDNGSIRVMRMETS